MSFAKPEAPGKENGISSKTQRGNEYVCDFEEPRVGRRAARARQMNDARGVDSEDLRSSDA
jgi:hypothetical protein